MQREFTTKNSNHKQATLGHQRSKCYSINQTLENHRSVAHRRNACCIEAAAPNQFGLMIFNARPGSFAPSRRAWHGITYNLEYSATAGDLPDPIRRIKLQKTPSLKCYLFLLLNHIQPPRQVSYFPVRD
jgi:hypothetical protein